MTCTKLPRCLTHFRSLDYLRAVFSHYSIWILVAGWLLRLLSVRRLKKIPPCRPPLSQKYVNNMRNVLIIFFSNIEAKGLTVTIWAQCAFPMWKFQFKKKFIYGTFYDFSFKTERICCEIRIGIKSWMRIKTFRIRKTMYGMVPFFSLKLPVQNNLK